MRLFYGKGNDTSSRIWLRTIGKGGASCEYSGIFCFDANFLISLGLTCTYSCMYRSRKKLLLFIFIVLEYRYTVFKEVNNGDCY